MRKITLAINFSDKNMLVEK